MRRPIALPDLGSAEAAFSLWLVALGDRVFEGDRVAEVLVSSATVEVAAAAEGTLVAMLAQPGDRLHAGQVLGFIE